MSYFGYSPSSGPPPVPSSANGVTSANNPGVPVNYANNVPVGANNNNQVIRISMQYIQPDYYIPVSPKLVYISYSKSHGKI